jgi:hypothetical protein
MATINDIWGDRSQAPGPRSSSLSLERTSSGNRVPTARVKTSIDMPRKDQTPEERGNEIAQAIERSDAELKGEFGS